MIEHYIDYVGINECVLHLHKCNLDIVKGIFIFKWQKLFLIVVIFRIEILALEKHLFN